MLSGSERYITMDLEWRCTGGVLALSISILGMELSMGGVWQASRDVLYSGCVEIRHPSIPFFLWM